LMDESSRFDSDFTARRTQTKQTEETVLRVAAGVNERFNWNLLFKFVNDMQPTPDGQHMVQKSRTLGDVYPIYFKNHRDGYGGPNALALKKKRLLDLSKERTPTAQDAKDDEIVKRDQVAVNVEGISQMYFDDLKPFADHLKERAFTSSLLIQNGMSEK